MLNKRNWHILYERRTIYFNEKKNLNMIHNYNNKFEGIFIITEY